MEALSDSSVIKASSSATSSPSVTATSITSTSLAPPRSGTLMSTVRLPPPADACAAGLSAAGFSVEGAGSCAEAASASSAASLSSALPSSSTSTLSSPSETVSPSLTNTRTTLPPLGDGTSMLALSDSSVIRVSSGSMTSPSDTATSMISTASLPPISGTLMISLLKVALLPNRARNRRAKPALPPDQLVSGLGLLGSMPYFLIASATTLRSSSPRSASALSAATVTK